MGVILPPRGHLAMSTDIFDFTIGIQLVEAWDTDMSLTMHRTAPHPQQGITRP